MTEVYISISEKLRQQVAEARHIDLYNEQYDFPEKELPFSTPATFIEFMPIPDWITNSDGSQTGTLTIRLHNVTACYSDTHDADLMDSGSKSRSFDHLKYVSDVHKAIHLFAPVGCTKLVRLNSDLSPKHDQLYVCVEAYKCTYTDNSTSDAAQDWETVTPELTVTHPIDRPESEPRENVHNDFQI